MKALSTRRAKILEFIGKFIDERGYAPSVRDVTKGCGISSSSVTQYHLDVLEREGHLRRDPEVSRSIALPKKHSWATVPVLGIIAAGQPIPVPSADSWATTPEDAIELPDYLTGGLTDLYALKVKGTSMIDAMIDNGDVVVMQMANIAEDGQTVAVWLKDRQEVTLKKIYREPGRIRLQPANTTMGPIYSEPENVEIQGRVVAVLRRISG